MTLSLAFFTFLNAWWIMMFIALPLSSEYAPEGSERGKFEYASGPKTIHWKKAFTIAAILAFAITLALALLFKSGIVPLHNVT